MHPHHTHWPIHGCWKRGKRDWGKRDWESEAADTCYRDFRLTCRETQLASYIRGYLDGPLRESEVSTLPQWLTNDGLCSNSCPRRCIDIT
jgi:hypothetical protein